MQLIRHAAIIGVLGALVLGACAIDETHYETITVAARTAQATVTCATPFVAPELADLEACGDETRGAGHCFPGAKVPFPKGELEACAKSGDVCVPDPVLRAGGTKAKSCTFFLDGKPGSCVSMLSKGIFTNKDLLKQDACAPDERCLPCVDPRNGKETGVCNETGVHEGPCTGGTGEKPITCCHKMGECVLPDAVPEEARASMVPDSCKNGRVCAPISQLDGKPVKCDVLGSPGVCLDVCFAGQLKGLTALSRGGCRATELCMPCALANASGGETKLIGCE